MLLLITALTVLSVCLWQTFRFGSQKSLTTDLALTLTRLAQWQADTTGSALTAQMFTHDGAAQLVAAGDVQSGAIQRALGEVPVGAFKEQGAGLLTRWQSVRGAFSELNLASADIANDKDAGVRVTQLPAVSETYGVLFDAITTESLSQPLLALVSDIRGELVGLEVLSSSPVQVEALSALVERIKERAAHLDNLARPTNGPALLGYQSTLKLDTFFATLDQLNVNTVIGEVSDPQLPAYPPAQFLRITSEALSYTRSLLQSMETELQDSRRNVLLAVLLSSLALLLAALMAWGLRQKKAAHAGKSQQLLRALHHDLGCIANGDFTHRSTLLANSPPAIAIAESFNAAVSALDDHDKFCRGMLDQSSALAVQQQEVIEAMEVRLAALPQTQVSHAQAIESALREVDQWLSAAKNESHAPLQLQQTIADSVNETAASFARLTAQLDISCGRIERALSRLNELRAVVGDIESSARQSSLQALNESIKRASLHDLDIEPDRFVENAQRSSQQVQTAADNAVRSAVDINSDLEASAMALRECHTLAEEGSRHLLESARTLKNTGVEPVLSPKTEQLQAMVNELITAIQQSEDSNSGAVSEAVPQEELLYLKGHALELQLLAAEYHQSTTGNSRPEVQADEQ